VVLAGFSVHEPSDSAIRAPPGQTGVVAWIDERPDKIDVTIPPYAAVYHLLRSHLSFGAYRRILQSSLDGKRTIMFTYQTEGMMLTYLELTP
jgi:hypothetical protein